MGAAVKLQYYSYEEYLQLEQDTGIKHEYHAGVVVAMAGGTLDHSTIGGNAFVALQAAKNRAGKDCKPYNSDVKIYVKRKEKFLYADASLGCDRPIKHKSALTNPSIIVEVLSDSTGDYDRGDKFYFYRQILSLREYILVNQYEPVVEVFTRHRDLWRIKRYEGLDQEIPIDSLGVSIPLSAFYRDVDLENSDAEVESE